jgi:hypothetical protein
MITVRCADTVSMSMTEKGLDYTLSILDSSTHMSHMLLKSNRKFITIGKYMYICYSHIMITDLLLMSLRSTCGNVLEGKNTLNMRPIKTSPPTSLSIHVTTSDLYLVCMSVFQAYDSSIYWFVHPAIRICTSQEIST